MSRERLLILFGPVGVEALTQSARCSVIAVEEYYRDPAYADEVIAVGKEMGVLPIVASDDLSNEEMVEDMEEFLRKLRNR